MSNLQQRFLTAARQGRSKELLICLDLDPMISTTSRNEENLSGLMLACKGGFIESVLTLLQNDKNLNIEEVDNIGTNSLMFACLKGKKDIVKLLLEHKSSIDKVTSNGRTALHHGVYGGNLSVVEMLVNHGAKLDVQSDVGVSAFMFACEGGFLNISRFLLEKGATPNLFSRDLSNGFYYACVNGHLEMMKFLVQVFKWTHSLSRAEQISLSILKWRRRSSHQKFALPGVFHAISVCLSL